MTCPNCGAQLEIRPSLEPFACPFCGTELLQAPPAIVGSTESVPAWLAFERMIRERNELSTRRTRLASAEAGCTLSIGYLLLPAGTLVLLGALFGDSGSDALAVSLLMLLVGTGLVTRARSRRGDPELVQLSQQIADLDRRIGNGAASRDDAT